ncbi:MAG: N-acetyltransferase [Verrucomicrobiaceae bacterium]|nr:MAG: N-acetyltransferase [Verrucomicrobiaceae bacterium]
MPTITDNTASSRFELEEDGALAYAEYQLQSDLLIIPYVFSDPALRGKGTAGRLMDGVLARAKEQGWKVRPICGYAAAYIERHAEYRDLRE